MSARLLSACHFFLRREHTLANASLFSLFPERSRTKQRGGRRLARVALERLAVFGAAAAKEKTPKKDASKRARRTKRRACGHQTRAWPLCGRGRGSRVRKDGGVGAAAERGRGLEGLSHERPVGRVDHAEGRAACVRAPRASRTHTAKLSRSAVWGDLEPKRTDGRTRCEETRPRFIGGRRRDRRGRTSGRVWAGGRAPRSSRRVRARS